MSLNIENTDSKLSWDSLIPRAEDTAMENDSIFFSILTFPHSKNMTMPS